MVHFVNQPGCNLGDNCCGFVCAVADADASKDSLASMGWVASDTDLLDVDNQVSLGVGDHITTSKKLTKPGYSLTVFFDVDVGAADNNDLRNITGGTVDQYEGLRIEAINDADEVVAYAEMPAMSPFDLNGTEYRFRAYDLNGQEIPNPTITVNQVYKEAKFVVCFAENAIQIATHLYYPYNLYDEDGVIHRHTGTVIVFGSPSFLGKAFSETYEHAGNIRLRLKNNSQNSSTHTYRRVLAERNYDVESVPLEHHGDYEYGCDSVEPTIYNEPCDDCTRVCPVLPGNRHHPFQITNNPFAIPLRPFTSEGVVNCDYTADTFTGPGFFYGSIGLAPPVGLITGSQDFTWTNSIVTDPFTGQRTSGTYIETLASGGLTFFAPAIDAIHYTFSAQLSQVNECDVRYFFQLTFHQLANPDYAPFDSTVYLVDPSAPLGAVQRAFRRKNYSNTQVPKTTTQTDAGPPKTGTGTVNLDGPPHDFHDDNTMTFSWSKYVPKWKDCSQEIELGFDEHLTAPYTALLFPNGGTVDIKFTTNSYGDIQITDFDYVLQRHVIDLAGKSLLVRGC